MKCPDLVARLSLLLALPFALGATMGAQPPLQAGPEPGMDSPRTASFAELDRNNDGVLTPDELPADHALAGRFAQHDLDGDQAISRAEYEAWLRGDDEIATADDDDEEEY
jgi:hypothetical protein